jgi:hypothetical protein
VATLNGDGVTRTALLQSIVLSVFSDGFVDILVNKNRRDDEEGKQIPLAWFPLVYGGIECEDYHQYFI